jgi:ribosomal-protein-alanine N-acetyltransferase
MTGYGGCAIRDMLFDDLDAVTDLEKKIFTSPWSADLFRYELSHDEKAIYLLIENEHHLLGYIGAQIMGQEVHVTNMAVEVESRRLGLGSALLLACIRIGLERGARWVTLEVRRGNEEALNFYREFGFSELGMRQGYYTDTGEDAVIMATGDIRSRAYTDFLLGLEEKLTKVGGNQC